MLNLLKHNSKSRKIKNLRGNILIGLSVYDSLVVDLFDEERGCSYEPWSCINDERMAVRSKTPSENKIIYSIKATQAMNSDMAVLLRDCMKRGKIKFLSHEEDGREV